MPHLSPMKWLLTMMALWLTLFIIQAGTWWDTSTALYIPNPTSSLTTLPNWKWLQDGRK